MKNAADFLPLFLMVPAVGVMMLVTYRRIRSFRATPRPRLKEVMEISSLMNECQDYVNLLTGRLERKTGELQETIRRAERCIARLQELLEGCDLLERSGTRVGTRSGTDAGGGRGSTPLLDYLGRLRGEGHSLQEIARLAGLSRDEVELALHILDEGSERDEGER